MVHFSLKEAHRDNGKDHEKEAHDNGELGHIWYGKNQGPQRDLQGLISTDQSQSFQEL